MRRRIHRVVALSSLSASSGVLPATTTPTWRAASTGGSTVRRGGRVVQAGQGPADARRETAAKYMPPPPTMAFRVSKPSSPGTPPPPDGESRDANDEPRAAASPPPPPPPAPSSSAPSTATTKKGLSGILPDNVAASTKKSEHDEEQLLKARIKEHELPTPPPTEPIREKAQPPPPPPPPKLDLSAVKSPAPDVAVRRVRQGPQSASSQQQQQQQQRLVRHDGLRHAEDVIACLRHFVADGPTAIDDIPDQTLRKLLGDAAFEGLPQRGESDAANSAREKMLRSKLVAILGPVYVISLDTKRGAIRLRPGVANLIARVQAVAEGLSDASAAAGGVSAGSVALGAVKATLTPQERKALLDHGGLPRLLLLFPELVPTNPQRTAINVGAMRRVSATRTLSRGDGKGSNTLPGASVLAAARAANERLEAELQAQQLRLANEAAESMNAATQFDDHDRGQRGDRASRPKQRHTGVGASLFSREGILGDASDESGGITVVLPDGAQVEVGEEDNVHGADGSFAVAVGINRSKRRVVRVTVSETPTAQTAPVHSSNAASREAPPQHDDMGVLSADDDAPASAVETADAAHPVGLETSSPPPPPPTTASSTPSWGGDWGAGNKSPPTGDAAADTTQQTPASHTGGGRASSSPAMIGRQTQPARARRSGPEELLASLGYEWVAAPPALARGGSTVSLERLPPSVERKTNAFMSFLRRRPPPAVAAEDTPQLTNVVASLTSAHEPTATFAARRLTFTEWVAAGSLRASTAKEENEGYEAEYAAKLMKEAGAVDDRLVEAFVCSRGLDGYDTAYTPDARFVVGLCRSGLIPTDWARFSALASGCQLPYLSRQAAAALRGSLGQLAFFNGSVTELRFRRVDIDEERSLRTASGAAPVGWGASRDRDLEVEVRSLLPRAAPTHVLLAVGVLVRAVSLQLEATIGDGTVSVALVESILADGPATAHTADGHGGAAAWKGLRMSLRGCGGRVAIMLEHNPLWFRVGADGSVEATPRAAVEVDAVCAVTRAAAESGASLAFDDEQHGDGSSGNEADALRAGAWRALESTSHLWRFLARVSPPHVPARTGSAAALESKGAAYLHRNPLEVLLVSPREQRGDSATHH